MAGCNLAVSSFFTWDSTTLELNSTIPCFKMDGYCVLGRSFYYLNILSFGYSQWNSYTGFDCGKFKLIVIIRVTGMHTAVKLCQQS